MREPIGTIFATGAVCDGVTDDGPAIRAALARFDVVVLPPGLYSGSWSVSEPGPTRIDLRIT